MGESARAVELNLAVKLDGVARAYQTRQALLPISFSIRAGEFVSLLGPSGSGKSTILRMMAGLETWDQGSLAVTEGTRSFVFQDAALLPWRTVLGNVVLPLEVRKSAGSNVSSAERALQALDRVGLRDVVDLYPNQLSGGMKMRVSVARAIVSEPSLLLLDEPFAALDERTRFRLQEDLRELWKTLGMTVVFVTHSVSEAVFVSDRAIVLSGAPGRVVEDRMIDLGADSRGTRSPSLRSDPRYLSEIVSLNQAFDNQAPR